MSAAVPCRTCSGAGYRPLSFVEIKTIAALDSTYWRTTKEVAAQLGLGVNATINRLYRMELAGLVMSRRSAETNPNGGRPSAEWLIANGASK